LAGEGNGHVKETIKHAKEGLQHEKEAIKHLKESLKGSSDAHTKEALEHAKEAVKHAEESLSHAEQAEQLKPAKPKKGNETRCEACRGEAPVLPCAIALMGCVRSGSSINLMNPHEPRGLDRAPFVRRVEKGGRSGRPPRHAALCLLVAVVWRVCGERNLGRTGHGKLYHFGQSRDG
jgi:hypothetical protein